MEAETARRSRRPATRWASSTRARVASSRDTGVGATPTAVAAGEGAYWVTNASGNSVSRIDPGATAPSRTIPVGNGPSGIAIGDRAVWVVDSLNGTVSRIDPGTNTVVQRIGVGNKPLGIAYTAGLVWVANRGDGTITKIDPERQRGEELPITANQLAYGDENLWRATRRTTVSSGSTPPTNGPTACHCPSPGTGVTPSGTATLPGAGGLALGTPQ